MEKSAKVLRRELKLLKKRYWECLRRNQNYKSDYAQLLKMEKETGDKARQRIIVHMLKMAEKYLIATPVDPKEKFSKKIEGKIQLGQIWFKFPKASLWSPVQKNWFRVVDGHEPNGEPRFQYAKRSEALEESRYMTLRIDVNLPDKQIRQLVSDAVKTALSVLEDTTEANLAEKRRRLETQLEYFPIWDDHKAGKTFLEIGKKKWDKIDEVYAEDRTKRAYRKAEELIQSVATPTHLYPLYPKSRSEGANSVSP